MRGRLFAALALWGWLGWAAKASPLTWEPSRTWVFAVGVLEFQNSGDYPSFPQENRADARLMQLLQRRGVDPAHMVFLKDRQATRANIESSLSKFLEKTGSGDWVILYYCGHGSPGSNHRGYFVPYDGDEARNIQWSVDSLFQAVSEQQRGQRVLFCADCCYSGTVARRIRKNPGKEAWAALTSSNAREASTGAWTYTESLIEGFSGNPVVDQNGDGQVTLAELGQFVEDEMVFAEDQLPGAASSPEFPPTTVLAHASGAVRGRVGERVEALDSGSWWPARIVEEREGAFKVHYYGYSSQDDAWLKEDRIRSRGARPTFAVGQAVEVLSEGKYYPAHVREVRRGIHLVHYDQYDRSWDEWVGSQRIRAMPNRP